MCLKLRMVSIVIYTLWITSVTGLTESIRNLDSQLRFKRQTSNTAPSFAQSEYRATAQENQPAGLSVMLITATDPDQREDGKLSYSMTAIRDSRSNEMFTINPISGKVTTTKPLDREEIPRHDFVVTATDNNALFKKSAVATLIVNVEDENDHTPTFDQAIYKVETFENIPVATSITTVRAIDKDTGKNQEIRYSIIEPANPPIFKIDPISGSILTLKVLDREVQAHYELIVQAKDQADFGKQRSSSATIEIKVKDENDNFPQFSQRSYTVNVSENLDISTRPVIAHISATDVDEGHNQDITYSFTGGNMDDTFYIDPTTGEVSVQKPLDYEVIKDYTLKIKASDSGQFPRTSITNLWIRIVDLNDNPPYFQNSVYNGSVIEGESIGAHVLTVRALDNDDGINSQVEYSLINVPPAFPFAIDPDLGEITVRATLDREIQSTYSFTVQANDKGQPQLTATVSVEITINNTALNFQRDKYTVTVREDVSVGSLVLTVHALHADIRRNTELDYSITGVSSSFPFAVEPNHGNIFVRMYLDREIRDHYVFTVQAKDHALPSKSAATSVEIIIVDVNDNVPVFAKFWNISISEDSPLYLEVLQVSANDADLQINAHITYNITGGNYNQTFSIGRRTGIITLEKNLHYTVKDQFILTVTATDGKYISAANVYIQVIDNNLTFAHKNYQFNVSEGVAIGTKVGVVEATDNDAGENGRVTYELLTGTKVFSINANTGEIRTKAALDREAVSAYSFEVRASDNGGYKRPDTAGIIVIVIDQNDNAPVFFKTVYETSIRKPVISGKLVTTVFAVDADFGINSQVRYHFPPVGNPLKDFTIDSMNGAIHVAKSNTINTESAVNYTLRVLAEDRGNPRLTTTAEVRIKIEDPVIPVG